MKEIVIMNQTIKKKPEIISRTLSNKLFLFNEISQDMFCLNENANAIWQLIDKNINYTALLKEIKCLKIGISEDEVKDLINFLIANNLIEGQYSTENIPINNNVESMELWKFVNKHTGRYYPITVTWEITYKCNQTCIHCYEDCDFTKNMQDLDIESIRRILIDLKKNGCFILNITGGEPFARKDIFDILRIAKELNFSIVLYSNASIIKDSDIFELKKIGISKLCITLFSLDPQKHDKIANRIGLQIKTLGNILKLRETGIPVRINAPLTKYNFDGYKDLVSFSKEKNCELVITPTMTPKDDGDMSPLELCLNDDQFETILLDKDINVEMEDDRISLDNKLESVACNVVFSSIAISADGKVYPCNTFKLECGNLKKDSLSNIWNNSEVLNKLRTTKIKQISDCNNCPSLDYCLPCPAYSWLENKKIVGKSCISCRTARIRQKLGL
ncbi:hypothetical protein HQ49_08025 [Porphyromonas gulae]|nr:hypothetical protein HQ49_08025 [Porphyromonas gulae]